MGVFQGVGLDEGLTTLQGLFQGNRQGDGRIGDGLWADDGGGLDIPQQHIARQDQAAQHDFVAAVQVGMGGFQAGAEGITDVVAGCGVGQAKLGQGVVAMQQFQADTRRVPLYFLGHADKVLHQTSMKGYGVAMVCKVLNGAFR